MKYAIVIPDGCADEPVKALGGLTPLQAAKLPNMDRVATLGVVGRTNNVPPSLTPASDVATLSLFGYDPLRVYTGRAPLETAAMGIRLDEHIVGPLLDALPRHGDWRILISPDHRTTLRTRTHAHGAVPFAVACTGIKPLGLTGYDELIAAQGKFGFDPGWHLMNWFLEVGV